jgi:preprotein translocase subunit SecG
MSILYIFLTVLMFLDCVLLVFLVLLQLPKKDAGAGMAFGGAATDALFGAGSGNVLTKITKYMAGIFFGLALLMALLAAHKPKSDAAALAEKLVQRSSAPLAPAAEATPAPSGGGFMQLSNVAPAAPSKAAPAAAKVNTNK